MKNLIRTSQLLYRHILRVSTFHDEEELARWKTKSGGNLELYNRMVNPSFYSSKTERLGRFDEEEAFNQFKTKIATTVKQRRLSLLYKGAAVVLLIIGVSALMFLDSPYGKDTQVALVDTITPGSSKATLILGDGKEIALTSECCDSLIIEGQQVTTSQLGLSYKSGMEKVIQLVYNTLVIPRKGEYQLELSDGTLVWLNSDTRIKYPVVFSDSERRVYLEGEAFFKVKTDEDRPFYVEMGNSTVKVTGTSFNARAYKDEHYVCTCLVEGSVSVEWGGKTVVLEPNWVAVSDKRSGALTSHHVADVNLYTGWVSGRFVFDGETLEDIMSTLSRWYDVVVFFGSDELRCRTFTGNLPRYENFHQLIDLLEMTGMAHFEISGNTIIINDY